MIHSTSRNIIGKGLLVLSFLLFSTISFSKSAEGYIVTLNSDTIYGLVQISHFDQTTGGLVLKGIEEESFHYRVNFKAKNTKKYKTFFSEMIYGFRFIYNGETYIFKQIAINRNSIFNKEKLQYKFVRVTYDRSDASHCYEYQNTENPGLDSNRGKYIKHKTHYIKIKSKTESDKKETLQSL